MEFIDLIPTHKLDGVILHGHLSEPIEATLCLTGHHLIMSCRQENVQELCLLHKNIDTIERRPNYAANILLGGTIVLKCKDLRNISLDINTPQEYLNVSNSIESLSNLNEIHFQYPFFYRPNYTMLEDGYAIYKVESEFSKLLSSSEDWRLSTVNKDFSVCPTYGSSLVVPKSVTDEQLIQSAAFRDGGRFPVLSYKHESNGAIMMRSSQPLSGQGVKRCRADEAILNCVLCENKKGLIIDTWGKKSSNIENDQHYSQWKKVTRPLGNLSAPSALLDSFAKLIEACNDVNCSSDKWLNRLESSGWLGLVLNGLNTACVVAQCLDQEGIPVLVHGGKGLDSTIIVTSLVQIILNPDCRTVQGLQALIDREWLQGGYPFQTRHKQSCYTTSQLRAKTSGASFILFLDCIYQLFSQFPCSFEFSSQFLIVLFENSYFSQFGTFLCDSEKDRVKSKIFTDTTSLWSYINLPDILKSLLNPLYGPNRNVIWPSVAPISLILWSELYLRWVVDQGDKKVKLNQIQSLINREKELKRKVKEYRNQVRELCKEYQKIRCSTDENSD